MLQVLLIHLTLLTALPEPSSPSEPPATPGNAVAPQVGCQTLTGTPPEECGRSLTTQPAGPGLRVARIGLELVMGAALGFFPFVGGVAQFVIDDGSAVAGGFLFGTAHLMSGFGVNLAGLILQGDGSFLWSMTTAVVLGAGSAAFLAVGKGTTSDAVNTVLVVSALAILTLATIVVYELTSSTDRRAKQPKAVTLVPSAGLTRDRSGGTVGLAGLF